jgi:pimeloyl-ACP methyl ester carboxylesterase
MPRISSPHDSASLFYQEYIPDLEYHGGSHTTIPPTKTQELSLVFLHGWPMSSRMWQHLLVPACQDYGFRCIAPDRRGFGESEWNGPGTYGTPKSHIDFDTYADDVAYLLETVATGDFIFVGASMGSGESLLTYERSAYVRKHCKVRPASKTQNTSQSLSLTPPQPGLHLARRQPPLPKLLPL